MSGVGQVVCSVVQGGHVSGVSVVVVLIVVGSDEGDQGLGVVSQGGHDIVVSVPGVVVLSVVAIVVVVVGDGDVVEISKSGRIICKTAVSELVPELEVPSSAYHNI